LITEVNALIGAAKKLGTTVDSLHFSAPVTHTLNPLDYAWVPHEAYLRKFGNGKKRVIFMGMNPGPFGMVLVGVPFGEVNAVRGRPMSCSHGSSVRSTSL
jgi:single-strand selective monofunctional uracil DNA glycosylase